MHPELLFQGSTKRMKLALGKALHLPLATGHPEKTMFSGVSLVLGSSDIMVLDHWIKDFRRWVNFGLEPSHSWEPSFDPCQSGVTKC